VGSGLLLFILFSLVSQYAFLVNGKKDLAPQP